MKPLKLWLLIILLGFSFPLCALPVEVPTTLNTKSYAQNIATFYGLNSTKNLKILKIIGYQQTLDWTCGPAVAMSLLYYYGKLSAKELNQITELRIAKEMGTSVKIGTSAHQIVRFLNKHGFKAKLRYHGTLSQLQANLNKGIPTLVDWIDWGGHWVIVAGYNKVGKTAEQDKDTLFFADSAVSTDNVPFINGLSKVNPHRFQTMWFNSTLVPGIYITAIPKKG